MLSDVGAQVLGHGQVVRLDVRAVFKLTQQLLQYLPGLTLGLGAAEDLLAPAGSVMATLDDRLPAVCVAVEVDASGHGRSCRGRRCPGWLKGYGPVKHCDSQIVKKDEE